MNQDLEKRLLNYSAMAAAVSLFGFNSKAQCYYYDENPDVIITGHQQSFSIDFNNDSNTDISVQTLLDSYSGTYLGYQYTANYTKAIVTGINSAEWIENFSGEPSALYFSSIISSSKYFLPDSGTLASNNLLITTNGTSMFNQNGVWHGLTDYFLGIRFLEAGNSYYGWIRMDVSNDADSVVIKDWGYNMTPDALIQAGTTCSSNLQEQKADLIAFHQYQNSIELSNIIGTNGSFFIADIQGKEFVKDNVSNNLRMDLSGLPKGIYFIQFSFNEGVVSRKFILQ